MGPTFTLTSARRPGAKMGLWRSIQCCYIPSLLLSISAFIFGVSVILSALTLITVASNIDKLRNAVGSWGTGINTLSGSQRGRSNAAYQHVRRHEGRPKNWL